VVGEIVVVFYGLESCGLAEEAEVVDWDGGREEDLYGWSNGDLLEFFLVNRGENYHLAFLDRTVGLAQGI
jgi:hypothetical protein